MARHLYSCPLRWADMDAFGHVNNVVYLRYLEEARVDFMWRLAPGGGSDAFTGGVVVARHEIDYLKPLVHRHAPVTIETWVTKIGSAFTTLAYEVKDEDAVYARASTVIVPYDLQQGRPRRITSEEQGFLREYLEPAESAKAGRSARSAKPVPAAGAAEATGEASGAAEEAAAAGGTAVGRQDRQDREPEGAVV